MIIDDDEVIAYEMLAEQQETGDESATAFLALLLAILASIEAGEPLKKTKKIIDNSNVNIGLEKNLRKIINEQLENITGEPETLNFEKAIIAGYTFTELLKIRKRTTTKQATRVMTAIDDALKEKRSVAQLIKDEVKKYEKNLETFYRTQTKSAREFGYAKNDKALNKEVKGWVSVAVLDNKTSAICVRLHNKFYSKENYATRFDIPFQIPRHPNCRSTFVTVFKGRSIQSYKGKNINTFLNNNPTQGEAILGIEKYRLFKEGKKKITSFVDIKGKRFYTNEEIKKRLNIK